jgi:hypothetical protein
MVAVECQAVLVKNFWEKEEEFLPRTTQKDTKFFTLILSLYMKIRVV